MIRYHTSVATNTGNTFFHISSTKRQQTLFNFPLSQKEAKQSNKTGKTAGELVNNLYQEISYKCREKSNGRKVKRREELLCCNAVSLRESITERQQVRSPFYIKLFL